jgi:hypothetical protein
MAYAIPTELERRQLFYYLKRGSSYSAWAEWAKYYKEFVDVVQMAFEDTQRNPPPGKSPLIEERDMAFLLSCYSSAEGALQRLRAGDKTVFKFIGYGVKGAPYFCEAYRAIEVWNSSTNGVASFHGLDFAVERSRFWPQIERALNRLNDVAFTGPCWEGRHTDEPAPVEEVELSKKRSRSFRDMLDTVTEFPDVPVPEDEVLVRTGESCPCFGIWEPVKAPLTKGYMGLFKRPEVPADKVYELDGCMNYLHQGSPAPTIGFAEDDARGEGRSTVWRLIWIDDRYKDGTIPEEEAAYVFLPPADRPSAPAPEPRSDVEWVLSGLPASRAGVWAWVDGLDLRVRLQEGELLPLHTDGDRVAWVHVPDV